MKNPNMARHGPRHKPMSMPDPTATEGSPSLRESDLVASICLESFEEFVREFWEQVPGAEPLKWNWHMGVICQELQEVAELAFRGFPKKHDLIINISPGTSKSSICSILFPAWVWARMPSARVLTASHADDLVLDLANKARHVIKSEKYQACFPDVKIRDDQDTKGYYATTRGGDRKTATVGGKSPIGFHGLFLIVDDPLDTKKAVSDVEIQTAAEFMTGVLPSRKVNKEVSVTILIHQRLHRGDPTGVLLEKSKNPDAPKIRQVCLPCSLEFEVKPEELKGRYTDGLMDPTRLSEKSLKEQRSLLGEYTFCAQFGQSPRAANAGMFEEHYFNKREKAAPYDAKRIRYWDRACLVAGTLVETSGGPVPIEDIRPGDMVLTRQGYCEVEWSGVTKEVDELVTVRFGNGSTITGTADHLVWTENNGWVRLDSLGGGTGPSAVHSRVVLKGDGHCGVPVYDLTVKGAHEFFANGILVHNSTPGGGCLTAGVLMAKDPEGHFYVEHVVTGQWDTKDRNNQMRAVALRDRARYGPNYEPIIYTEREGGSAGKDAWREVARALAGFVVREDRPTGDKVTRAEPWSSQCAAGNVSLIEDGSWDLGAYIQEHCMFPDGTFKDRVDASTGAFNLLVGWKKQATLHTLPLRRQDKKMKLRLTVTCQDDLPKLTVKGKEVLVRMSDPDQELPPLPEGVLSGVLSVLDLVFMDVDPRDLHQVWDRPLADGHLPQDVVMSRAHGKKFWAALTKKYSRPVEEVILVEDGGGRAVSLALALCDVLRVAPEHIEYSGPGGDTIAGREPPNRHVYDTAKASRGLVV